MSVLHKEYRCAGCKKLLFKGWVAEGEVQVKCKACHTITEVVESKFDALLCAIEHCPRRIVPKAMEKAS